MKPPGKQALAEMAPTSPTRGNGWDNTILLPRSPLVPGLITKKHQHLCANDTARQECDDQWVFEWHRTIHTLHVQPFGINVGWSDCAFSRCERILIHRICGKLELPPPSPTKTLWCTITWPRLNRGGAMHRAFCFRIEGC